MKPDWVEDIAATVAALMALLAFFQSLRTRKNSAFNALFSQLIANHKEVFADKPCTEFYKYFADRLDDVKTVRDLVDIWAEFQKNKLNWKNLSASAIRLSMSTTR